MNNDEKVLKALEALQADVTIMKGDITSVKQGQAHTNTALEALAAGQESTKAELKADIQDLRADVVKKIKDHEARIEDLEEDAGIPHPHKN
jgi:septal ring factor EnvC (AmiA/AmiB activator)